MTLTPTRLCAGALFALLALTVQARADYIPWSFTWSSSPGSVSADGNAGSINMLPNSGMGMNGMKDILAAQLQAVATSPPADKATFSNGGYSLTVTLHDGASGQSGSLTFTGTLGGYFTPTMASIANQFNKPFSQTITLGQDSYTVVVGSFASPGSPGSGTYGRIGADVIVSGPGMTPPVSTPEPATLVLAVVGVSAVGVHLWRQRRRHAASSVAQPQAC